MSEQTFQVTKNPSDLLRRVYDILVYIHITFSSPESKYENDDVMVTCNSLLKNINAKI